MTNHESLMMLAGSLVGFGVVLTVLLAARFASRRAAGEPRLSVVNWFTYVAAFSFYLAFVNLVFLISCASGVAHASMGALRELNNLRRESIEDYSVTLRHMINGLLTGGRR